MGSVAVLDLRTGENVVMSANYYFKMWPSYKNGAVFFVSQDHRSRFITPSLIAGAEMIWLQEGNNISLYKNRRNSDYTVDMIEFAEIKLSAVRHGF